MCAALFCCPKSPPVFDISEVGAADDQSALGSHVRAAARYRAACLSPAPPCVSSASRANSLAARAAALCESISMIASKSSMALEPGRVHAGDTPAVEDVPVPGVEVEDPAVVLYRQLMPLQAAVGQPPGRKGLGVAGLELQGPVEVPDRRSRRARPRVRRG